MDFGDNKKLDVECAGESASFGNAFRVINIEFIKEVSAFFAEEFETTLSVFDFEIGDFAYDKVKSVANEFTIPFGFDSFRIDFAGAKDDIVAFVGVGKEFFDFFDVCALVEIGEKTPLAFGMLDAVFYGAGFTTVFVGEKGDSAIFQFGLIFRNEAF